MEQKHILGVVALLMVSLLGVGMVSAFGNFKNRISEEDKIALENAMDSGDYEAWASIKRAQISDEKFEEARARHQERAEFRTAMQEARESGDRVLMEELKAEFGQGKRMHKRNINSMPCNK
jgi:hypothetical protein